VGAFPLPAARLCVNFRNRGSLKSVKIDVVARKSILLALPLVAASLVYSGATGYLTAQRKLDEIASDRLKPGTRVTLTGGELNAYVAEQARRSFPEGVRQPQVSLGANMGTGSALIDFNKIRRARGESPGWLASKLLDGERPVKVNARLSSGGGRAQVDVESVEISGMTIDGRLLDFMIDNYLRSYYPSAKVGQPFELGHNIERIEVRPAGVDVLIGR
jgi:hypothetical protein